MAPPAYTMYLDQSAHLDWDWIQTFENYYDSAYDGTGVRGVLLGALANLKQYNAPGKAPYYYSICEAGFLARFVSEQASRATEILAAGENFQVIGGGITSPDALVCSGEGFLRNYLVGRLTLAELLPGLQAKPYCVIPDDFGQGPELPVLLQALGFPAIVFSRLPGTVGPDVPEPMAQLLGHGVDFLWRASDGSEVVAHWMLSPGQGSGDYGYAMRVITTTGNLGDLMTTYRAGAVDGPYTATATPFMYYAVEDDFSAPVDGLLNTIDAWNTSSEGQQSGVFVRAGTFADFMDQVLPLRDELQALTPYDGTPYWTGYYASRPALKILHYGVLRSLLEAEVFGLLAASWLPKTFTSDMAEAWKDFAPSTHHDFVCGTANDEVYLGEQLPRLTKTSRDADALRDTAMAALAGTVTATGAAPVVVANGLGFARTDLAELPSVHVTSASVQPSYEGGSLFMAEVPSFGFATLDLAAPPAADPPAPASVEPTSSSAAGYTLANEFMEVTITAAAAWGIERLVDKASGEDLLAGRGNDLVVYVDCGDIYRFGNEGGYSGLAREFGVDEPFSVDQATVTASGATVLETGPLRVRVSTTVHVVSSDGTCAGDVTREYALVAGEPFLRMATTGAAFPAPNVDNPPGWSVMTRFPLARAAERMSHGTGCHWTDVGPLEGFWSPPVFQATHDFVLPKAANGDVLAAVYHGGMPAWALDETGALFGCLLRNTPGGRWGASGTDTQPHTQTYALRVPSGLGGPHTGQPLREARRFSTPPQVRAVPTGAAGAWSTGSLAAASDPAILTVAKRGSVEPGAMVLRLYQPTNAAADVEVTLAATPGSVRVTTALEQAWTGPSMGVGVDGAGLTLTMPGALATVQVGGAGRS